ncbi:MAG: glutamine--fructose-6-phosphate aminotransferase, partial [bacterium]
MCGIVGYVGKGKATPVILDGLARLEYRGYDSAGIAVLHDGRLEVRRTVGRLAELVASLKAVP